MRCGITLLGDRVAPRCWAADGLMVVVLHRGHVTSCVTLSVEIASPLDLLAELTRQGVDTLVCGGITRDVRDVLSTAVSDIVDNVACSKDEIPAALEQGVMRPGFGLSNRGAPAGRPLDPWMTDGSEIDCLRCADRLCLRGEGCGHEAPAAMRSCPPATERVLETAMDVALEDQRQLCRLAELVYFCLGMNYRRIGLAFCADLLEPAHILAGVLRRFFEVVPVCCKVGGVPHRDQGVATIDRPPDAVACNPIGVAALLNERHTDLNVLVGFCIGVDCVFTASSQAPVTTLFVKDRSLANNPIAALYSEYYMRESLAPDDGRGPAGDRATGRTQAPHAQSRHIPSLEQRSDHDHPRD